MITLVQTGAVVVGGWRGGQWHCSNIFLCQLEQRLDFQSQSFLKSVKTCLHNGQSTQTKIKYNVYQLIWRWIFVHVLMLDLRSLPHQYLVNCYTSSLAAQYDSTKQQVHISQNKLNNILYYIWYIMIFIIYALALGLLLMKHRRTDHFCLFLLILFYHFWCCKMLVSQTVFICCCSHFCIEYQDPKGKKIFDVTLDICYFSDKITHQYWLTTHPYQKYWSMHNAMGVWYRHIIHKLLLT